MTSNANDESVLQLTNQLRGLSRRCRDVAAEFSLKGSDIVEEMNEQCEGGDEDEDDEDFGQVKRKIFARQEECYIRRQLLIGADLLPTVLEIERDITEFHDVTYKEFRESNPALASEVGYHFEYEMFNIFSFVTMMKDVCVNENKEFYEEIILSTNELEKKLFYLDMLQNYIVKVKQSPPPHDSLSLLCRYAVEDNASGGSGGAGDSTMSAAQRLDVCVSVIRCAKGGPMRGFLLEQSRPILPKLSARMRTLATNIYKNVRAAVIGSEVISATAMELFLGAASTAASRRRITWAEALEHDTVRRQALKALASEHEDEDADEMLRLVRDSPANQRVFDGFRRMLTKDNFFGTKLSALKTATKFPLEKISLFAVNTHGSCSYSADKSVRISEIPEGLTVYYFTNVSHDLTVSISNFGKSARVLEDLASDFPIEAQAAGEEISEKELVELLIPYVKEITDERKKGYSFGDGFVVHKSRLNATHAPFFNEGTFLVKRYRGGEAFPFRFWSSEKSKKSEYILFSPSIAEATHEVVTMKTLDTDILFETVGSRQSRALVLIDFACKVVPSPHGTDHLVRPVAYSGEVLFMYTSGEVVAFLGGRSSGRRSRKRARRSRPRTVRVRASYKSNRQTR